MEAVDCVVIGAGVVGLACARALAAAGREVLLLEREARFGSGISARSSEVIHAGLYYPPGSLKAQLCVEGRQRLYAWCEARGVAYQRCGKLVLGLTAAHYPALQQLAARAQANGVANLRLLEGVEVAALEPALNVHAALFSPDTGIVDGHELMLSLLADAEQHGATLACNSTVLSGRADKDGVRLRIDGGGTEMEVRARHLINAAGLDAPTLARALGCGASAPPAFFARGVYFSLRGRAPFSRLIYPLPEPGGLGVHLTLDLAGQARFGPDVEWLDAPDYRVDPARAEHFYRGIRAWWPALADDRLQPDYAGVRPKIVGPGAPDADFRIDGAAVHGVPGLVQLYGIESPGLTAALAIGDRAARLALQGG